ncbi:class I SAM-dependent methyltransferase [Kangiella sp. HD9-110m-PIT-SAG06]|nr:class I SAM-dependent methyltransferase [Kangiella sp. HD9-110m-PIT-SAG06]RDX38139.1 class I SAM-dependent methyltransferase [Kangiella sp. HD9-110m-PIT-SAG07]
MTIACPLCYSSQTEHYLQDNRRCYQLCNDCQLIFVPSKFHLNQHDEKRIYDLHENSPQDEGYQQFLNKLLTPLTRKLTQGATGLDFGCGPGPTIQPMLEAQGFKVTNYDLYYQSNDSVLEQRYDFITCTEVIEHFNQPRRELELLHSLLRPNAYLGIMTKRPTSLEAFKGWHYKNDLTHICFFSEATFHWIADYFGYRLEFPGKDTAILQR